MKSSCSNRFTNTGAILNWMLALLAVLTSAACSVTTSAPAIESQAVQAEAAKQREIAAAEQAKMPHRLDLVALRIVKFNAPLCTALSSGKEAVQSFAGSQSALGAYSSDMAGAIELDQGSPCGNAPQVEMNDKVQASTNGQEIVVTSGLIRFV